MKIMCIELFHLPTLMQNSLFINKSMLHYYPWHVSSINMPIFRRTNCIHTASGIVDLCKRLYNTPVESRLQSRAEKPPETCRTLRVIKNFDVFFESALNQCTVQTFTESEDTRCCVNTICPAEDGHVNARNISRIVV